MNAILLCAGRGVRFQPISFICPKSLVRVNNIPIVEQTLQLLRRNNVQRITIVTGYMTEKFDYLAEKYGVELVYNPQYETTNNNTSLSCVKDRLDGSLIIDGDLVFLSDFFPHVQPEKSCFVSQRTTHGLEWEFMLDAADRVLSVDKWSPKGYAMVGVSYWQGEAARLLAAELSSCAPDEYWEDAAVRVLAQTPVYVVRMEEPFLREIDSAKDALDFHLLTHEQIAEQSSVGFKPVKLKGLTNNTWLIRNHENTLKTLRIPGTGTERYIHREHEPVVVELIRHMGLTPLTDFYHGGLKTTDFLDTHRISSFHDMEEDFFAQLANALEKLHSLSYTQAARLSPLYIAEQMAVYEKQSGMVATEEQRAWLLKKATAFDAQPQVLSHRDLLLENILVSGNGGQGLQLIDFEYAGFAHPLWDAASFILEAGIAGETRAAFINACKITEVEELAHMEILVDYIWGLWGMTNGYVDYGQNRLARFSARFDAIKAN